jgi:hypothetical protein
MGRNVKSPKGSGKLTRQSSRGLIERSARNEWREFVRETPTGKFYAIGVCAVCLGTTLPGLVVLVFGSQRNSRLGNLLLATGGYSVLSKLKRWMMGRRTLLIK